MNELLGWIANLFFVFGTTLIARKFWHGFILNIVGNFLYLIVGEITKMHSLSVLSLFLIGINVYGIFQWKFKV